MTSKWIPLLQEIPVKWCSRCLKYLWTNARIKIPAIRVTREPDTYVRLWLHVAKDHHGGQPEYRFRTSKREKPKQKKGPSCHLNTGKLTFLRVEDLQVVGPELLIVNEKDHHQLGVSACGCAASRHHRTEQAPSKDDRHRQFGGGGRSPGC